MRLTTVDNRGAWSLLASQLEAAIGYPQMVCREPFSADLRRPHIVVPTKPQVQCPAKPFTHSHRAVYPQFLVGITVLSTASP